MFWHQIIILFKLTTVYSVITLELSISEAETRNTRKILKENILKDLLCIKLLINLELWLITNVITLTKLTITSELWPQQVKQMSLYSSSKVVQRHFQAREDVESLQKTWRTSFPALTFRWIKREITVEMCSALRPWRAYSMHTYWSFGD